MKNTKILTLTAMVMALCAIGALIKIPVFSTTAALDAAPAFISAVFLPPLYAGIAGGIGHMLTALTSGMPLGPFHFIIAGAMFIVVWIFALLHRRGQHTLKWIWALVSNGIVSPLPFYFLISPAFYISATPGIVLATILNLVLAAILMPILQKVFARKGVHAA